MLSLYSTPRDVPPFNRALSHSVAFGCALLRNSRRDLGGTESPLLLALHYFEISMIHLDDRLISQVSDRLRVNML